MIKNGDGNYLSLVFGMIESTHLDYGLNFTNYSSAGLTVICKMKWNEAKK